MVLRASLVSCAAIFAMSATPTFAQSDTTIVREAVPVQAQTIIANSPEDLALQEEIRKIRAYNQYVDSQVGISGTQTETNTVAAAPAISSTPDSYAGSKIELYAPSTTTASATSAPVITPTTTIIERQPVAGATSIYRVAEGDTLYNLSKRNCVSVESIQDQNQLSSSNIQLGQVLTMPANQCHAATTTTAGTISAAQVGTIRNVAPTPVVKTNTYAVLPKDSLYSIGKRYCLSAGELAVANGLTTSAIIQPGQVLQLPNKACAK